MTRFLNVLVSLLAAILAVVLVYRVFIADNTKTGEHTVDLEFAVSKAHHANHPWPPGSEVQCHVSFPIATNQHGDNEDKFLSIFWQTYLFEPLYSINQPDSADDPMAESISFKFNTSCATAFNYYLIFDLYPEHVRQPFFEKHPQIEGQAEAWPPTPSDESSAASATASTTSCAMTSILPSIREDFEMRVPQYLRLHLSSFERLLSVEQVDGYALTATLLFNSTCDQVLADYLMQKYAPADYYGQ